MSGVAAGRELDAEIARKVKGYAVHYEGQSRNADLIPHYSTDLIAAWLVVEKMQERGWRITIEDCADGFHVWYGRAGQGDEDFWVRAPVAIAATAPLAICLAALHALRASLASDRTPENT